MATSKVSAPNQFSISGFVAIDAQVRNFDHSSVARFPLSLSRKETAQDGTEVRKSALVNCEVWAKDNQSSRFDLLTKGNLVVVSGYIKPENYTDRNGVAQSRITFVCTSVAKPAARKTEDTAAEAPAKKSKKNAEKAA
ncbi:MAG: single-stranded DNA-binding protein [Bacteroidales bacterium]|nr:single-stranded DNA-binding protein [Bacteroidales bacterium]